MRRRDASTRTPATSNRAGLNYPRINPGVVTSGRSNGPLSSTPLVRAQKVLAAWVREVRASSGSNAQLSGKIIGMEIKAISREGGLSGEEITLIWIRAHTLSRMGIIRRTFPDPTTGLRYRVLEKDEVSQILTRWNSKVETGKEDVEIHLFS